MTQLGKDETVTKTVTQVQSMVPGKPFQGAVQTDRDHWYLAKTPTTTTKKQEKSPGNTRIGQQQLCISSWHSPIVLPDDAMNLS